MQVSLNIETEESLGVLSTRLERARDDEEKSCARHSVIHHRRRLSHCSNPRQ